MTGQRLGRYMKDNLLDPLGMNDTAFKIGEAQRKRLAKIHARTPDGLVSTDTEIPQEPEFEMGGGGLYSTVGDYLKFAQAILNGGAFNGAQALKPETVELMSKNAMGDIRCRPLKTAQPPLSNDVDFLDGMSWGLSFLINPEPLPTGRSAGFAGLGGPRQFLLLDRSGERRGWRLRDADSAVLRPEGRRDAASLRERGLPSRLEMSDKPDADAVVCAEQAVGLAGHGVGASKHRYGRSFARRKSSDV